MRKQDFIEARLQRWNRLQSVLLKLESRGPRALDTSEKEAFMGLYRVACSDLARARSEGLGDDLEEYLNDLVARGHKQFYPPERPSLEGFVGFFRAGFPRAVRAKGIFILASALLFVGPLFLSAWAVFDNPKVAFVLAPPELLETLRDSYADGHVGGRAEGFDSLMTGYYINNNVGIAFRCFATGAFFGLGSLFFLVINGILTGTVGAYICQAGHAESFLSFVVGHGAFELTAIVLSGAVGLRLGALLVNPGQLTRLGALRAHVPSMITVMLGVAAMLLVAAVIEGFWSPSSASPVLKLGVGAVLWVLVFAYLLLAGSGDGGDLS